MSEPRYCLCGHTRDAHDSLGCCVGLCLCKGFIGTTAYDSDPSE
jgi:hypothetical protein